MAFLSVAGYQCPCVPGSCGDSPLPSGERQHEGHVGVRFGDTRSARGEWQVIVDSIDVTHECIEAVAGNQGYAWLIECDGLHVICRERNDVARLLVRGEVSVSFIGAEIA